MTPPQYWDPIIGHSVWFYIVLGIEPRTSSTEQHPQLPECSLLFHPPLYPVDSSRARNSRSNPCIPKCGGKEDPTLLGLPKPYAKDGWRWPGIKFAEASIEKGRGEVLILSCAANITTCLHPHPDNSARSQAAFTEETSASP